MKLSKVLIANLLFIVIFSLFISCGGGGDSSDKNLDESLNPTPNFTPSSSESLANLAINTFTDNGISLTTDPNFIDFNENGDTFQIDDEAQEKFTIKNDTGETRKISLQIYSVSSGFSLLDENEQNLGAWKELEIASGDEASFYIHFNAWQFGTHTSNVTITSDVEGFIQLPFRTVVTGASDLKIIPTGYLCTDSNAPTADILDFLKVADGQTKTQGVKLCNSGGEDITVNSVTIEPDDYTELSIAMDQNAFDDFIWHVTDEINSGFAFGQNPTETKSFVAPQIVDYPVAILNPAQFFDVAVHHNGGPAEDLKIGAGRLLQLDVNFSPKLDEEAGEDELFDTQAINAKLVFDTSLGPFTIPLKAASSGVEPVLKMSYRYSDAEPWRDVDLTSDGAAIYFSTVKIFYDWVSNNAQVAEIKVENIGTGIKNLEFYGGSINGYFEYYWDDSDEPLTFPITLAEGESKTFKIRYLPSANDDLDEDFEANYNFGQFYFEHTGGNGPSGRIVLVGEQDAGYAVELFLGGAELQHEYDAEQFQNLCVFKTDNSDPTQKTFTVVNNNKLDKMRVNWSVSYDSSELTLVQPENGSLDVDPNSEGDFSIKFAASGDFVGSQVGGTLTVETYFPDHESTPAPERTFVVPFKASASESGESALCGGGVLGEDGVQEVTFIMDRILMALAPSLPETNRNLPPFKFHLPMELDAKKGTVRLSRPVPFIYEPSDPNFSPIKQIRSYVHQSTNIRGCAPLPSNPYRLEFEKGSWTGVGLECDDDGPGTIKFTHPATSLESGKEVTINSDTACLDSNGGEEYVDTETGTKWVVFYHDFLKIDDCRVKYYGKIATFAFRPDQETIVDVFDLANESPNESESFYEQLFGAFQHDSYITFLEDTKCGSTLSYTAGSTITDPDEIKEFYTCLSGQSDSTRVYGFINECSYFNFSIDEGKIPDDVDSPNPDYDSWEGFGIYEPHVDDFGKMHMTKRDITIYNAHMKAFVVSAGDRFKLFAHPGHLVYSDVYATITTKRLADEGSDQDGTWQKRLAVKTRPHFDKSDIFLEDGNPLDIKAYWTEDGMSSQVSNVLDDSNLEPGIDYGGFGKGNFKFVGDATNKIIMSGLPINFDENNLAVLIAAGSFTGQGNVAPSFAKADAGTGKGKALYFTFHGCFVAGDPEDTQGCYDFQQDSALMPDGVTPVVKKYDDLGMLPGGILEPPSDCSLLEDPGFADRYDYKYMTCKNFKIQNIDRDRQTNYYNRSGRFVYEKDYYSSTSCGQGM